MKLMFSFVLTCTVLLNTCFGRPVADNAPQTYASRASTYPSIPASYSYDWSVKDDYSNNNYGQTESREGDKTTGSYYVLLPDGRTQTVTYSVDGYGGYVAKVTYTGEAKYPKAPKYQKAKPYPASY